MGERNGCYCDPFEKLIKKARQMGNGDIDEEDQILANMVLSVFLAPHSIVKKPPDLLGFWIPHKKRSPCRRKTKLSKRWVNFFSNNKEEEEQVIKETGKGKRKRVATKDKEKKKRKRVRVSETKKSLTNIDPEPTPDLPIEYKRVIEEMKGTVPQLLMQKRLTKTDMEKHNSRLSIPNGKLKCHDFLSPAQRRIVHNLNESIKLTLIDPALRKLQVRFTKWKMGTNFVYNLIPGWTDAVQLNQLKQHQLVQLWWFHVDSNLSLALVNLDKTTSAGDVASSSGICNQ